MSYMDYNKDNVKNTHKGIRLARFGAKHHDPLLTSFNQSYKLLIN
jgi:hypothetical protein